MKNTYNTFRVLHLVRSLDVGGLEKVVLTLVKGLQSRGLENHVGCLVRGGNWIDRFGRERLWIGRADERSTLSVILSLCRYVKRNGIDLIHSHNLHPHKIAVPVSVLARVPLVHTQHGQGWWENPRWMWLSRQLSRFTKKVVAVSGDIARIITDIEKVPPGKVVTIRNGIDPEETATIHDSPFTIYDSSVKHAIPGAFVIGSVGRFYHEKNYPLLVRAFARFIGKSPGCSQSATNDSPSTSPVLILVGDGPDRNKIESEISACGIEDRVILPGMQDNIRSWLSRMDVFCLSSWREGTSITLLEACAAGLPAVVTDVGGNAEIVENGVTGIVVPSRDEAALAGAFGRIACDENARRNMGIAARRKVANEYSADRMVGEYMELYDGLQ